MKTVKSFKMFETPDDVFNQKLRHKKKDAKVYNDAIGYCSTDAITFSYDYNDQMVVSAKGKEITHSSMGTGRGRHAGRLWFDRKIITFWDYPKTYKELEQTLKEIQEVYARDRRRKKINFWDGDWQIETGYKTWDKRPEDFKNREEYYDAYNEFPRNMSILIPITDYKEGAGPGWTPEQKAKAHVADWKEREKLKQQGVIEHPKGFGSEYKSKEVQKADSVSNKGSKMSMAQYHNIKKKYMGESYIMKFETYNTHVIASPDEIKATAGINYVDLDYFGTEVERDEKEPPNPTGRDDREVKNKTKKSAYKMSVESIKKFEEYNVQDMMSIPTSITKGQDPDSGYIQSLQPYYDFIKALTGIKDLSQITYEQVDQYTGFSFVAYFIKVMILSDKENVHMLINKDLIPLEEPSEIIKILESEA